MQFTRIDAVLVSCRTHLDATGSRNTDIESFLVGYALAVVYAEFEERIRALVALRVARGADAHVVNFGSATVQKIVKSIRVSEIAGVLAIFDSTCKDCFHAEALNTAAHVAYDNIISNRHLTAHSTGAQMTFAELEKTVADCIPIFDAIVKALGLTAAEIAPFIATPGLPRPAAAPPPASVAAPPVASSPPRATHP